MDKFFVDLAIAIIVPACIHPPGSALYVRPCEVSFVSNISTTGSQLCQREFETRSEACDAACRIQS
jgi:hypothetical protein